MSAREDFESLGYEYYSNEWGFGYIRDLYGKDQTIYFNRQEKFISITECEKGTNVIITGGVGIWMPLFKAIQKQIEELGW
jgi:hypothetical protein